MQFNPRQPNPRMSQKTGPNPTQLMGQPNPSITLISRTYHADRAALTRVDASKVEQISTLTASTCFDSDDPPAWCVREMYETLVFEFQVDAHPQRVNSIYRFLALMTKMC